MTMVLGCSTRIGHGRARIKTRIRCRPGPRELVDARIEPDAAFDVVGKPFRRGVPGVSITDECSSANAECSASRWISQQLIESTCQLRCIVAINHIPGPALLDEIRNCADVGGADR